MNDHYFSAQPASADKPKTLRVRLRDTEVEVLTTAGIFSPNGLDKGTAVLLDKVPYTELAPGSLALDLGCGWGPISLALADEHPDANILGVDVNERSIELTSANASANGFSNVKAWAAGEALAHLSAIGQHVDLIWSNPPIRIGKDALHELLLSWLPLLSDDGVAYMVVQKNLGADSLAAWLDGQGFPTTKVGSSKGFRVLETRRG